MDKEGIVKIPWSKSIWFFDVDDTLIDTATFSPLASEGIRSALVTPYGKEAAARVQQNFNKIFNMLMLHHSGQEMTPGETEEFKNLLMLIEGYQKEISEKYGTIKKFSREVLIKIACDVERVEINPVLMQQIADAYWNQWNVISDSMQLLPSILVLFQEIRKHKRPIFLFTGSDARFKLNSRNQFEYVPEYSEAFKNQRVQSLRKKGIDFDAVSIGDPIDKPHIEFFQKTVKIAEENMKYAIDLKNSIIIGDSYRADLQVPKEQMSFGLAVLFNLPNRGIEINDDHQITTNNLLDIYSFLRED